MSAQPPLTPSTLPGSQPVRASSPAEDALLWLRATLGTVAPRDPKTRRLGPRRHRLDLLAELCDRDTFLLVTSWLGSDAVPAEKSKRDYADDVRMWSVVARELGNHERFFLGAITPEIIETWTKIQKAKEVSPRTVNRRLSALTSLTKYAAWKQKNMTLVSPVSKFDRPKVDMADEATMTPVLEVAEYQAVMEAATTARQALVVALLYTLAGRVTECCVAQASSLITEDGKKKLALVRKRGKPRNWPIPSDLLELIDVALAGRTEGPLLLDDDDKPMDRHAIDWLLTKLGKLAGVLPGRDLTPHVLRASRLTHMHDQGVPLKEIKDYADHASILTTERYVRMRDTSKLRAKHAESATKVYRHITKKFTAPA